MTEKRFRLIYVEITNVCNLSCSFCPGTARAPGFMSVALFRNLVPQLAHLTDQAALHVMGEPLLHPHLETLLDCAGKYGLPIMITTNGVKLPEAGAILLRYPAVRQINISLHSLYDAGQGDYEERLQAIFAFTRQAFEQRPELYLNYRLWNRSDLPGGEHITAYNRVLASRIGNEFSVTTPDPAGFGGRKSRRLLKRLYLHVDTVFAWPEITDGVTTEIHGRCHGLVDQLAILQDGTVVPCCLDREGCIAFGNAAIQTLTDILSGPRATSMLEGMCGGKLVEPLCQHCTFRRRFR